MVYHSMDKPQQIGIKAIEIYFPNQCVEQADLERYDGVSEGKYTIGLGQTRMSFCDDREDIYSITLTTVSSLLKKYAIDPKSIGRLEVGTETLLDKSKSVKTVLMQLFEPSQNTDIEGVDTINACYGGTNALFNALNWVESSSWDGRDAIVVAGDIALYSKGPARPTGGAGCVAMLVGPDAPLVVEAGLRGSYMSHAYDFYKPDLTSEYPVVDGQFSVSCYTRALDHCYEAYNARERRAKAHVNGFSETQSPLDRFDCLLFHAPTCKLVAKSYARLLYNDFLADSTRQAFDTVSPELSSISYEASLTDKSIEKTFMALSKKNYAVRVQPSLTVPSMCGNMYTASLYSSLVSLLSSVTPSEVLEGKRIGMFSYGSGLASSMFSIRVRGDTTHMKDQLNLLPRLEARKVVTPEVYDAMCNLRKDAHLKKDYTPKGTISDIVSGTYYLTAVDGMFRRYYEVKA